MYQVITDTQGLVAHGVSTCHGCGLELVMRGALEVLGSRTIIVIPPGCSALFSGYGRETALKIPGFQGNLENTAAYASGIRRGLRVQGIEDVNVLGFAGDGATVDIGLQALSGAMDRGENIIYICYDNEAYMNTGIQGSGSTTGGAWTTTTPGGKRGSPKNMMWFAKAHHIEYAATASVAYLDDYKKKVARAKTARGTAYLHVSAPCPTGWGYAPCNTVQVAKLAVDSGCWPLYELEHGRVTISRKFDRPAPVEEYLALQKRFRNVSPKDLQALKAAIDESLGEIQAMAELSL